MPLTQTHTSFHRPDATTRPRRLPPSASVDVLAGWPRGECHNLAHMGFTCTEHAGSPGGASPARILTGLLPVLAFLPPLLLAAQAGCGEAATEPLDAAMPEADAQPDSTQPAFAHPALVLRILDGDTIEVDFLDQTHKIRFKGVDTPEMHPSPEPYAEEATHFTTDHVPPMTIIGLEFDDEACGSVPIPSTCLDIYGRLLAYIRTPEGDDLNALLLENGLARVYTEADFARKAEYLQIQSQAQAAGVGLWSQ